MHPKVVWNRAMNSLLSFRTNMSLAKLQPGDVTAAIVFIEEADPDKPRFLLLEEKGKSTEVGRKLKVTQVPVADQPAAGGRSSWGRAPRAGRSCSPAACPLPGGTTRLERQICCGRTPRICFGRPHGTHRRALWRVGGAKLAGRTAAVPPTGSAAGYRQHGR